MHRTKSILVGLVSVGCFWPAAVTADIVLLHSGRTYEGRVIAENQNGALVMELAGGIIAIDVADVRSVERRPWTSPRQVAPEPRPTGASTAPSAATAPTGAATPPPAPAGGSAAGTALAKRLAAAPSLDAMEPILAGLAADPASSAALLDALAAGPLDAARRHRAVEELARLPLDRSHAQRLANCIHDRDAVVASAVCGALRGHPDAIDATVDAALQRALPFGARPIEVRVAAVWALAAKDTQGALLPLIPYLGDGDEVMRAACVAALVTAPVERLAGEPTRQLLLLAQSVEPSVRRACTLVLKRVPGPDIEEVLAARLVLDEDASVRAAAAQGLRGAQTEQAREALARALADPSVEVRVQAARILPTHGAPLVAVPNLIPCLDDPDPDVRREAHRALVAITSERLSRHSYRWRVWWDQEGQFRVQR